jgi:hypothetical protein
MLGDMAAAAVGFVSKCCIILGLNSSQVGRQREADACGCFFGGIVKQCISSTSHTGGGMQARLCIGVGGDSSGFYVRHVWQQLQSGVAGACCYDTCERACLLMWFRRTARLPLKMKLVQYP